MNKNTIFYPVKNVAFESCGALYQKWKSKKRFYRKAPKNGFSFDVDYADTKDLTAADAPVILALHGAPGNHGDFGPVIRDLTPGGARVIAPNFPDYSATERTGLFRHTAEEKAEFLKDFLKSIDVPKIDMVVTHSSAVYPGLLLAEDSEAPPVGSLALINPSGHRRIKAMKPKWFIDGSVRTYLNPTGRWLYRKCGPTVFKMMGVPVKMDNVNNVLLSATTMYFSKIEELPGHMKSIRDKKVPLLYVFSENDKLVDTKVFYEMSDMLGANEGHFSRYDEEGVLQQESKADDWLKILAFKTGGHYAFLKFAPTVNAEIGKLLKKVAQVPAQTPVPEPQARGFSQPAGLKQTPKYGSDADDVKVRKSA